MAQLDRRSFLARTSVMGAILAAHECTATEEPIAEKDVSDQPLIRHLELLASAPLVDLKAFYHKSLGLDIVEDKNDRLTFMAGRTLLTFLKHPTGNEKPFYHFAFNIPENKAAAARDWQAKRTPILPIHKSLRDPKYPEDMV